MNRSFSSTARLFLALTLLSGVGGSLHAAPRAAAASPWRLQANPAARPDREAAVPTTKFQAFTADLTRLRAALAGAPLDIATAAARGTVVAGNPVEISLPMPRGGRLARFRVEEIALMEPALAAKYPDIKTYRGTGIDDPAAQLALDVTPFGMHAQILSPSGRVYISPYYFGGVDDLYASYYKEDAAPDPAYPWACEFKSPLLPGRAVPPVVANPVIGTPDEARAAGITPSSLPAERFAPQPHTTFSGSLRTYRLAVAANHQYVATTGGTKASALAAIVVVINRVSAIYEADCALRLVLVANDDVIIYPDASTDPFTANDTTVINTSTATISAAVGAANYDIGHVFTTGSGGISGLGVVCTTTTKGRSTTGLPTPIGDAFNVDYVVHEMGHEFGANHTFNGNTSNCGGGNRSAAHAYEPGSGSTIMAYAGICGTTSDLQPHSDSMFHSESIREILVYTAGTGGTCPVVTANTNTAPVVNAGPSYTIPISTPFTLTGSATDADGDVLTYSWEEYDKGAAQTGIAADNGASPIFRTFAPVYSPSRTFPKMSDLVNNTTTIGEQLPTVARAAMTFRLTVRDNRTGGGATNSADVALVVSAAAGPFAVTAPNTAITVAAGSALGVTWNVANTIAAPVSVANVSIALSTDGGYTYPYLLASSVANSGSTTVTLPPGVKTTAARIKVAAVGNVFFNISNPNFSIQ